MPNRKTDMRLWLAVSISAIILVAVAIWVMANHQPVEQIQTSPHYHEPSLPEPSLSELLAKRNDRPAKTYIEPLVERTGEPAKTGTTVTTEAKTTLNDVIKTARTWQPDYNLWFGETATDFTLTDIAGKQHKLSDYRGKNVMIVFWATWCAPCIREIPHLIALRDIISEDELAILAISYITPRETTETIKNFVEQNERINYTVFSVNPGIMPAPFSNINAIPCSFFINPQGKIKLATVGTLSLGTMKAILEAE